MTAFIIGAIVFASVLCSGLFGLWLRSRLAAHHLSDDSLSIVKLGTGLMATLAALVLGLLIASAKIAFDRIDDEFTQTAATVVILDRTLAEYGPEAKDARAILRQTYESAVDLFFPEDSTGTDNEHAPENLARMARFQQKLRELTPANDVQRLTQMEALARSRDFAQARWMVIHAGQGAIPVTFLMVLVIWMGILFSGFGLVSANRRIAVGTLFVCALAVSGAIFLIEDIAHPLEGIMQISRVPADIALSHLGN